MKKLINLGKLYRDESRCQICLEVKETTKVEGLCREERWCKECKDQITARSYEIPKGWWEVKETNKSRQLSFSW